MGLGFRVRALLRSLIVVPVTDSLLRTRESSESARRVLHKLCGVVSVSPLAAW